MSLSHYFNAPLKSYSKEIISLMLTFLCNDWISGLVKWGDCWHLLGPAGAASSCSFFCPFPIHVLWITLVFWTLPGITFPVTLWRCLRLAAVWQVALHQSDLFHIGAVYLACMDLKEKSWEEEFCFPCLAGGAYIVHGGQHPKAAREMGLCWGGRTYPPLTEKRQLKSCDVLADSLCCRIVHFFFQMLYWLHLGCSK